jgi:uncharacterized membrane protein
MVRARFFLRESVMRFMFGALVLFSLTGLAQAGGFYPVLENSAVAGLSHNGRIAVGVVSTGLSGAPSWRWTRERGIEMIPDFLDGLSANAWAQPIAGAARDSDGNEVAAIAYSNAFVVGPVVIGPYPGGVELDGYYSSAYGVADDGTAVGLAYDETGNPIAFIWNAVEGMTRLPVNRPDTFSRANGISHDGSIVFGWNDQADGYRSGVIWQNRMPLDLVDADGYPIGEASAANADGSVVVGGGYYTANGSEAWRWTAATGVQPIGILPSSAPVAPRFAYPAGRPARFDQSRPAAGERPHGFLPPESFAFAVSDDGNVVVGASGVWPVRNASIWTPATGLELLSDYASARGITLPDGWLLASASSISADGLTIGGWGIDPDGHMGAFLIDLHDDEPRDARVEAHGSVDFNDLADGPFAGIPAGTPVALSFVLSPGGTELDPGHATSHPIRLETFHLDADVATETLAAGADGPALLLTNDYPRSDGIHLFATPTASGQVFEFELFNPGGDLFDSDDLNRIDRSVGPEFFEKAAWSVADGNHSMSIRLDSVGIHDIVDEIFSAGFE